MLDTYFAECIDDGCLSDYYTVGKVYYVQHGKIIDDHGNKANFEHLHSFGIEFKIVKGIEKPSNNKLRENDYIDKNRK